MMQYRLSKLRYFFVPAATLCATGALLLVGAAKLGLNPLMTDKVGTETTVKALHPGWLETQATGYGWFSCPSNAKHGPIWRTKFKAINEAGKPVQGVVCEGILSAPEMRLIN